MKSLIVLAIALTGFGVAALAQSPPPAPAASTHVEFRGAVTAINLKAGAMPSIVVKDVSGKVWYVRLGSIRYLIANNFNPKAGQSVVVRGLPQAGIDLLAYSIECIDTGQKLTLRDESGYPLWSGGGRRRNAAK